MCMNKEYPVPKYIVDGRSLIVHDVVSFCALNLTHRTF